MNVSDHLWVGMQKTCTPQRVILRRRDISLKTRSDIGTQTVRKDTAGRVQRLTPRLSQNGEFSFYLSGGCMPSSRVY